MNEMTPYFFCGSKVKIVMLYTIKQTSQFAKKIKTNSVFILAFEGKLVLGLTIVFVNACYFIHNYFFYIKT